MSTFQQLRRNSRLVYKLFIYLFLVFFAWKNYFQATKTPKRIPGVTWNSVQQNSSNSSPLSGVIFLAGRNFGLGNQLFFYSLCYTLSKNLGIPLLLPVPMESNTDDHSQHKNFSNRELVLHHLSLPGGTYTNYQKLSLRININSIYKVNCEMLENKSLIPQEVLNNHTFFRFEIYCFELRFIQKYEEELKEIRVNLESPSEGYERWKELIEGDDWSVAVHMRKGDFTTDYWIPPIEYFKEGITAMINKTPDSLRPTFYVFSDEMKWAKEGLSEDFFLDELQVPTYFVTGTFGGLTNLEEFDLMTKCKSIVISSSTFSWWAAFLMESGKHEKIVIRPEFNKSWHQTPEDNMRGSYNITYPQEWIPLNV